MSRFKAQPSHPSLCPFCLIVNGSADALTQPADVIYQNDQVTAFISPKWWPNNPGHVIVVPNQHFVNIFDLPAQSAMDIHLAAQRVAVAFMELYRCEGISTRQHNGAIGGQEIPHYHLHLFPRYRDDKLYLLDDQARLTTAQERLPYAEKLRQFFARQASVSFDLGR
jgi:histidine triad (HIT) family protein